MMGCVAVDERARPLRPAIIWADQRAVAEAEIIVHGVGAERAYRITGHRASSSYSGAKILWVREHQPEIFARTHKFLHAKDFIVARLTGCFVTDYSDASGMNLYDLETRDWSPLILDAIGLDRALLPDLHASTDVVGAVTGKAAERGRPGSRHAGGHRRRRWLLRGDRGGRGARGQRLQLPGLVLLDRDGHQGADLRPGHAHLHLGAPGARHVQPVRDHAGGGRLLPVAARQLLPAGEGGRRRVQAQPLRGDESAGRAVAAGANGLLFLPYLLGERSPRWNPKARGAFIGLTMQHTRADMIRATLEGITLNLRVILEAFQSRARRWTRCG